MKRIFTIITSVALVLALLIPAAVFASSPIVNGSFETGNYTGWTLWEGPAFAPDRGTWGIASNGEVINQDQKTYDFHDGMMVTQKSPGLPITYVASDGNYVAYQLQNGPQEHRMYQDVTLSTTATMLSWDMFYTNHSVSFNNAQYLAVHIRDLNDNVIATLFKTVPDDSQSIPLTSFARDISTYAGSTVRIDVEMKVRQGSLDAGFDNFVIEQGGTPPGWDKGKKQGWDGSAPPGLEKKDKTPAGFDKGNKTGWE